MAKGNFQNCLPLTLKEEGGYSDVAGDSGGATQWGVTHATYDAYRDGKGLPRQDVRLITAAERDEIYRTGYWDTIGAEMLPAGVDLSAFDLSVNSGPKKARSVLTAARAGNPPTATIIANIASIRLSFLHSLAAWSQFGKGWGTRVARIQAASLKMAGEPVKAHAASAREHADMSGAGAIAAGAVAILSTGLHVALWIIIAAVVIFGGLALFSAFKASQQNAHADALDQAVADLAAKAKATEAAQAASVTAQTAASAVVTAQEQKIAAAKAAISATPRFDAIVAAINAAAPATAVVQNPKG
jgi:lysozyme family protein